MSEHPVSKKSIWSWALFDWANSSFTTIILTFVYGTYFSKSVATDAATGVTQWSYAIALSGFLILLLSPLCGALADHTGRLKIWTAFMSALCILGTCLLAFAAPHSQTSLILFVLAGLVLANIGFELCQVFYNSLLANVSTPHNAGRVSGLAWGLGYAGGLVSLTLALFGFIGLGNADAFFGIAHADDWHIRSTSILVAAWFFIFSLPFFINVPDKPATGVTFKDALKFSLISSSINILKLKKNVPWRNFLIGSALYRDGLNTLFALGGIYAAIRYGLETSQILMFGIGMNVTAGIGCWVASYFEDRFGSFRTIRLSIYGLLFFGVLIFFAQHVFWFFVFALLLGLFVGPLQSASRTIVVKLSSKEDIGGNFGFYALTGRAASFVGPLLYGFLIQQTGNQNSGLCVIIGLWLVGLCFVWRLKDAD